MAKLVKETEQTLPKKHLVSSNQAVVDSKYVDVANYHYVHISNMPSFDSLLHLNKVISMNETVGSMYDADVNDVRVEAWDFLLHGGGVYNNLSWEYTPSKPKGTPGADSVRLNLQYLQQFMSSFNFVKMKHSPEIISSLPQKAVTRILAEEGKQYALHIHHSRPFKIIPATSDFVSKYEAEVATFTDTISLTILAGNYTNQWYNPSKGRWIKAATSFKHTGGKRTFFTPPFITDVALRIIKK